MSDKQFYYTIDGTEVDGPVSANWLWEQVQVGTLDSNIQVCEIDTETWLSFTSLPDSLFSAQILAKSTQQLRNEAEAEQLNLQAQHRCIKVQAHIRVYGRRNAQIEQIARNRLEFIEAALKISPNNAKYLNTKALLLVDGLGEKERALALLNQAAKLAPNDIQIQQNIRSLK